MFFQVTFATGSKARDMAKIRELALQRPLPARAVVLGEIKGRSGRLAVQAESAAR